MNGASDWLAVSWILPDTPCTPESKLALDELEELRLGLQMKEKQYQRTEHMHFAAKNEPCAWTYIL